MKLVLETLSCVVCEALELATFCELLSICNEVTLLNDGLSLNLLKSELEELTHSFFISCCHILFACRDAIGLNC
nr:MAG TPA: hypothetical protein [Caudoviricetes sp.]